MRLFESKTEQAKNASPAKPGKRFVSFFIDLVVVIVLSFLFSLAGMAISRNTATYKNAAARVKEETSYYVSYISETHLVEYENPDNYKSRWESEKKSFENITKMLYSYYLANKDESVVKDHSDFVIDEDHNPGIMQYGESGMSGDDVAYFYTVYIPPRNTDNAFVNFKGSTPEEYTYSVYKKSFKNSGYLYFSDTDFGAFPTLAHEAAYPLFKYLTTEKDPGTNQAYTYGKDYYAAMSARYSNLLEDGERIALKGEPYYSYHYLPYREAITTQSKVLNITECACVFVAYLFGILLPKLLFKNEVTVGRLAMGLASISKEGEAPSIIAVALKSTFALFGFLVALPILYMFPPFLGTFDTMLYPFIGAVNVLVILIVIAVLGVINAAIGLFTPFRQTGMELLLGTELKDLRAPMEIGSEGAEEGRGY